MVNVPAVNAEQNRAMGFFMGLNKFAPNNAVIGNMAWTPNIVRQWKSVRRFYKHLCLSDDNRFVYKVFSWAHICAEDKKRNWVWRIHHKFKSLDLDHFIPINNAFHGQHTSKRGMVATSYARIGLLRQILHLKVMFCTHYQEAIEVH